MPLRAVSARLPLLLLGTALTSSIAAPAFAQLADPAPVRQSVDAYGVDLFLGTFNTSGPALTIGSGSPQGFSYSRLFQGANWVDGYTPYIKQYGSTLTISVGNKSDSFTQSGSTYTATEANGSTLAYASGVYTYTRRDGVVVHFATSLSAGAGFYQTTGRATDITLPTGEVLSYSYESIDYCGNWKPSGGDYICTQTLTAFRISTITTNYGYRLTFTYNAIDPPGEYPGALPDFATWGTPVSASVTNLAVASGASTPTQSFGTTTSGGNTYYQITDQLSRITKFRMSGAAVVGVTLPSSSSEDMTIAYSSGKVSSVTTSIGTTNYAYSDASGVRTVTVTDPQSNVTTYTFDISSQRMKSVTNALSQTTRYFYDGNARLTYVVSPEGTLDGNGNPASGYVKYTYDGRGNVTETRNVAKSGSGLSDIYTTASYDSSCSYAAKCNRANSTQDALGRQTDYVYDNTTGNLLATILPAPSGTSRPITVYSYSTYQAYYKNSGGSIVASGQNISLLTQISTCQTTGVTSVTTTLPCSNGSDEVRTVLTYGPQSSGTGNNLLPVSVTKRDGSNAISATSTTTYDDIGNVLTVDGPLSGTGDTTRYRYDSARRLVGTVGPDPDGGSSRIPLAQKTTYNDLDQVTLAEVGTVTDQSDGAWSSFSTAQQVAKTYDSTTHRLSKTELKSGGTTYAVTQQSYDSLGRPDCTAVRMDQTAWGSQSANCTATVSGTYGADRITKPTYDVLGRVLTVSEGVGISGQSADVTRTNTYTTNGLLATVKDGENNLTSYEYDGFDRLSKTKYPNTTKGNGSSNASDYEQLTYNANSLVTSRRLRDGNSIGYTYDNLGRLTAKDRPNVAWWETDHSYGYDLLGRMTSAGDSNGHTYSYTYNALSQLTGNSNNWYSADNLSFQYDAAGRRTQLKWNTDNLAVNYAYDVVGNVTSISDTTSTTLATYSYDNLARRTGVTFGNGNTRSYDYDAVSRLKGLNIDIGGSSYDLLIGQVGSSGTAIGYNPASQITSITRSNDAFAWTGATNVNRGYTSNGLNQYSAVGGTSFSYDARGNLTADGTTSYGYTSENEMSGAFSTGLANDSLHRLFATCTGSDSYCKIFEYDGSNLVTEQNDQTGAIMHRYVYGPGTDAPIVWYAGSGTSDRRYLQADERGSIIAVTDNSGNILNRIGYDEYGLFTQSNSSYSPRFKYTGQAYIPEAGLYYYKARMYSPTLGRFMQTDPSGYSDGLNWYNYVGGDPINAKDPSGLSATGSILPGVTPNFLTCIGSCGMYSDTLWEPEKEAQSPLDPALPIASGLPTRPSSSHQSGMGDSSESPNGPEIIIKAYQLRIYNTPNVQESLPSFSNSNFSLQNINRDSEGYAYVGRVYIGAPGPFSKAKELNILTGTTRLKVLTYTSNFVIVRSPGGTIGLVSPVGAVIVNGNNAKVVTGMESKTYLPSSIYSNKVTIEGAVNTPPNTLVMIWGK